MALVLSLSHPVFSQRLDVEPAWNGVFRPGEGTEVVVQYVADEAPGEKQLFELTLVDEVEPDIRYRHTNILPNSPLRVPVAVVQGGQLNLALRSHGKPVIETTSRLREARPDVDLVAIAASLATLPDLNAEAVYVAPKSLPVFPASYRAIDLLVLDSAALAALTPPQTTALEHHVSACGRTLFYNVEPSVVAAFLALAGCRGKFVASTGSAPEMKAAVELLLNQTVPALPTNRELQSLLVADNKPLQAVTILLALYLVTLGLAAVRGQASLLLLTPVFFTVITFLAFSGSTRVNGYTASWAETESGSAVVRYKTLLHIPGARNGQAQFNVSTVEEMFEPARAGTRVLVEPGSNGVTTHTVDISLLGGEDLTLMGSLPSGPMLEIALRDGAPVVKNPSETASSNATLAFNDQKYDVPALAPYREWHPAEAAVVAWEQTPIDRLFRERALRSGAALLVLSQDPSGFAELGAGNGYTMVRP